LIQKVYELAIFIVKQPCKAAENRIQTF
jgi:hypothetical protein